MSSIATGQDLFSSIGMRSESDEPATAKEQQKADFLLLMTEQIKHQNPLNPLEGKDFLAQLAQFSVVDELIKLNQAFDRLSTSVVSDQSMQAAALIGRDALVPTDIGDLGTDSPLTGVVDLPQRVADLQVNFYDDVGQLVHQLDLGAQPAGHAEFSWDGMTNNGEWAGSGTYRIEALADMGQGTEAVETLVDARVNSVTLGNSGGGLRLELDGIGPVSLADIRAVR